jgi:hypothetical protein
LTEFREEGYEWEGGNRDFNGEIDSYFPTSQVLIESMLGPLETAVIRGCYVSKKGRAVAEYTARKLISRGKSVKVRYLKRIAESIDWVCSMEHLRLKFEPHLDGRGIEIIMMSPCPEEILWNHLEYIRIHKDRITPLNHRELMAFDENSRVETFRPFPTAAINLHAGDYDKGSTEYRGITRSQIRKIPGDIDHLAFADSER